jgi:uncharacterized protein YjbI with pentapeptide repeats
MAILLLVPLPAMASYAERIDYTLTNQSGKDFHGQDLSESSFAGAVGRQANFDGTDLHGAIFTQGAFAGASFRGANLTNVLMDRVDFAGADFTGALLQGVIASGSSFAGANRSGRPGVPVPQGQWPESVDGGGDPPEPGLLKPPRQIWA